ncbi:MAG: leucine-rich repeat domain-containing protein, partial [Treponema sp.]|nr:leucine-rich repeat domain-containing protein [Treponema sp.]
IPENAFSGCKNLTDVAIGSGVTKIEKAFTGCEKLESILIPWNVTEIADFAFSQCKNLKNVAIINGNIKIGRRAFLACPLSNKDDMIARFGPGIFN